MASCSSAHSAAVCVHWNTEQCKGSGLKLIELLGIDEALGNPVGNSCRGGNEEKEPTPYGY
jgi:hypothetical protein